MYIHQAAIQALCDGKSITRAGGLVWAKVKITPTNTDDCCIIYSTFEDRTSKRWNPKADDLIADNWVVVDRGSRDK